MSPTLSWLPVAALPACFGEFHAGICEHLRLELMVTCAGVRRPALLPVPSRVCWAVRFWTPADPARGCFSACFSAAPPWLTCKHRQRRRAQAPSRGRDACVVQDPACSPQRLQLQQMFWTDSERLQLVPGSYQLLVCWFFLRPFLLCRQDRVHLRLDWSSGLVLVSRGAPDVCCCFCFSTEQKKLSPLSAVT